MILRDIESINLSELTDEELESLLISVTERCDDECYQAGIEYNLMDVELIQSFEENLGLINLVFTLAYFAGVNYTDTLGTVAIWDSIIFRHLADKHIAIPQSKPGLKANFAGGFVKEVVPGMYDWVMSFDLNSLYPNIIIQYNMSPETLVRHSCQHGTTPHTILADRERIAPGLDLAFTANGAAFKRDKQGFLPEIIEGLYNKRVLVKKEMINKKKEKEALLEKLKHLE